MALSQRLLKIPFKFGIPGSNTSLIDLPIPEGKGLEIRQMTVSIIANPAWPTPNNGFWLGYQASMAMIVGQTPTDWKAAHVHKWASAVLERTGASMYPLDITDVWTPPKGLVVGGRYLRIKPWFSDVAVTFFTNNVDFHGEIYGTYVNLTPEEQTQLKVALATQ